MDLLEDHNMRIVLGRALMTAWRIVEVTKPHRCCARCGATPADVRKMGWRCTAYGVIYDHHIWIWWEPEPQQEGLR